MATYYIPNSSGWQANGGGTYSSYLRIRVDTSYNVSTTSRGAGWAGWPAGDGGVTDPAGSTGGGRRGCPHEHSGQPQTQRTDLPASDTIGWAQPGRRHRTKSLASPVPRVALTQHDSSRSGGPGKDWSPDSSGGRGPGEWRPPAGPRTWQLRLVLSSLFVVGQ